MEKYNFTKIWVSRIIESNKPFRIKSKILSCVFKFGLIPLIVLFLYYFGFPFSHMKLQNEYLLILISILFWTGYLGPCLIRYYDETLLPNFFQKATDLVPDKEKIYYLAKKYDTMFSKKFWIISIPWAVLLLLTFVNNIDILKTYGRITGISDIYFWIGIISVLWIALLTSIGFWGVITTICAINELSKEELNIDPLHPDKLGGLSSVGYYAIGTTLSFSTGSLFLPAAFLFVSHKINETYFVYILVSIFSIFICISFFYPTYKIHKSAVRIRDKILDKLRKKYNQLNQSLNSSENNQMNVMTAYFNLYRINTEYEHYKNVHLYPFESKIFLKLISSIVLPFVFLVIDKVFFN